MHITLTDHLACPACGPESGLVLLADRLEERRVLEGRLGCPACRRNYPIRRGYAELRLDAAAAVAGLGAEAWEGAGARERALRLGGLMELAEARGFAVVTGADVAPAAAALAELVPGLEVVTTAPELAELPEREGVSRLGVAGALPIRTRTMRAAALAGAAVPVSEAVRVVRPTGRVVVEVAPSEADGVAAALESAEARVVAREGGTLVAAVG